MTSHQPLGDVPPCLSSDHTMIVKELTGYLFDKSTASPLLQIFNLWVYLYYATTVRCINYLQPTELMLQDGRDDDDDEFIYDICAVFQFSTE